MNSIGSRWAYGTMFLVGEEGVIACVAPPTLGERYLKGIREVTDKRITHLIYSHEHCDHIAGSAVFPADIDIVAHRTTAELLRSRNDKSRRLPTTVYEQAMTIGKAEHRLELSYQGLNHSIDNTFHLRAASKDSDGHRCDLSRMDALQESRSGRRCAWVRRYAHRKVLDYDFELLVADHVSRPGTRQDVIVQMELLKDLGAAAERAYSRSFLAFLQHHSPSAAGKTAWDLHNDYEMELVDRMVHELEPKWSGRLQGTRTYLRDNCWAMLETYVVQGAPNF